MKTRTPDYVEEGHEGVWPNGEPSDRREKFNKILAKQTKNRVSYPVEPRR